MQYLEKPALQANEQGLGEISFPANWAGFAKDFGPRLAIVSASPA
jgi:hypothetical protein